MIQNAAAHVVTGARKFDNITPVLCELNWLPIHQRMQFNVVMSVFQVLERIGSIVPADDSTHGAFITGI